MGLGVDGSLYRLLLLLHILCAAVGFGAVAFAGLCGLRGRGREGQAEVMLWQENAAAPRIAEYLIFGVLVFGILVALASKREWEFSQAWLSLAILLYLVELGLLHGVIHRTQRRYGELLDQVDGAVPARGAPDIAQLEQLEQLEQRIRLGWAGFDVIFLVILYLMVFTPGHVRVG